MPTRLYEPKHARRTSAQDSSAFSAQDSSAFSAQDSSAFSAQDSSAFSAQDSSAFSAQDSSAFSAQDSSAFSAQDSSAVPADDTTSFVDVSVNSPARRIATPIRAAMSLGAIAVCAALALPALTDGGGAGGNDAGASVPSALISEIVGDSSEVATAAGRFAAAPTTVSPADQWAAERATWTPEQELAFKLFVATPEERAAWEQFVDPPPPPPPPTTTPPTTAARKATNNVGGAPGGFLACVRHRESRGNYGVVNGSSGAGGAYQFLPGTWNNVARHIGRTDLIGVHPSQASRSDQDSMAQALYSWQGGAPWAGPGC